MAAHQAVTTARKREKEIEYKLHECLRASNTEATRESPIVGLRYRPPPRVGDRPRNAPGIARATAAGLGSAGDSRQPNSMGRVPTKEDGSSKVQDFLNFTSTYSNGTVAGKRDGSFESCVAAAMRGLATPDGIQTTLRLSTKAKTDHGGSINTGFYAPEKHGWVHCWDTFTRPLLSANNHPPWPECVSRLSAASRVHDDIAARPRWLVASRSHGNQEPPRKAQCRYRRPPGESSTVQLADATA